MEKVDRDPIPPQGRGRRPRAPQPRPPRGRGGERGAGGTSLRPSIAGVPLVGSETLRLSPSFPPLPPPSLLPSFLLQAWPGREGGSACSLPSRLPARATPGSRLPPAAPPAAPRAPRAR